MLDTVEEVIKCLKQLDKKELIAVTWWSAEDFPDHNTEEALEQVEEAFDICIGHINDSVEETIDPIDEDEEEEE